MSASEKSLLRVASLDRRAEVHKDTRSAFADRLALQGVALARRALAMTVSVYWPMRGEADVGLLAQALDYHQFKVCFPCVVAAGRPLLFRLWTPRDPLVEGAYGSREPSGRALEATPDLLFVPLVAFDRRGGRIGYGGGFYDETLRALRRAKPILAVGVGFSTQEVAAVSTEKQDEQLDLVLTDAELIDCGAS